MAQNGLKLLESENFGQLFLCVLNEISEDWKHKISNILLPVCKNCMFYHLTVEVKDLRADVCLKDNSPLLSPLRHE